MHRTLQFTIKYSKIPFNIIFTGERNFRYISLGGPVPPCSAEWSMGEKLSKHERVLLRSVKRGKRKKRVQLKRGKSAVSFSDLPRLKHKSPYLCWISVLNGVLWTYYSILRSCFWQWEGASMRSGSARAPSKPLILDPGMSHHDGKKNVKS